MIFDGKSFAKKKIKKLRRLAFHWKRAHKRSPKVVFVLIGQNPIAEIFVRNKTKVAEEIGVETETDRLHLDKSGERGAMRAIRKINKFDSGEINKFDSRGLELNKFDSDEINKFDSGEINKFVSDEIKKLSGNRLIDGIVVQLPLPESLKKYRQKILDAIDVEKDIDGLTTRSFKLFKKNKPCSWPAVVRATWNVLREFKLYSPKMTVGIVGAKGWVGMRLVTLFKNKKARKILRLDLDNKKDLIHLNKADLIISCVGRKNLIGGQMVKKGAVILDLGTMVVERGRICGDLKLDEIVKKAAFVSPVPGGIGPVTVACLFENLLL